MKKDGRKGTLLETFTVLLDDKNMIKLNNKDPKL